MDGRTHAEAKSVIAGRRFGVAARIVKLIVLVPAAYVAVAFFNVLVSPKIPGWGEAAVWCALTFFGIVLLLLAVRLAERVFDRMEEGTALLDPNNVSDLKSVSGLLLLLSFYTAVGCAAFTAYAGYPGESMNRAIVALAVLSILVLAFLRFQIRRQDRSVMRSEQ